MSSASARGLFRATGHRPKPVHVRDLVSGEIVKADHLAREKDEFYPTPPEPTRALLHAEGDRLRAFDRIWEPAAGDGAMGREMTAVGHDVVMSDLVDRGCGAELRSFLDFTVAPARAIVTNPPFNLCGWGTRADHKAGRGMARWQTHALDVLGVEYMALLMNWGFPGAGGLAPFWAKHPPARVYIMRWKIDFTGEGSPPMLNGWFVWDKSWQGETVLRTLDRSDARQGEMFGSKT